MCLLGGEFKTPGLLALQWDWAIVLTPLPAPLPAFVPAPLPARAVVQPRHRPASTLPPAELRLHVRDGKRRSECPCGRCGGCTK